MESNGPRGEEPKRGRKAEIIRTHAVQNTGITSENIIQGEKEFQGGQAAKIPKLLRQQALKPATYII